jgi:hypothetical protein
MGKYKLLSQLTKIYGKDTWSTEARGWSMYKQC